jgi:hypothetical protein
LGGGGEAGLQIKQWATLSVQGCSAKRGQL